MAADLRRRGSVPDQEESYLVSVSDLMVGLLFVFIIMLMAFALNYRSAEQVARVTFDELAAEKALLADERDHLALERDRLAAERDLLAEERDLSALERDELRAQRDQLGEVTDYLLQNDATRRGMLATVQDMLRARDVEVVIEPENGVLRLPENLLFDSGQAVLRPEGGRALRELATVLARTLPCYAEGPEAAQLDCPTPPQPLLEAVLVEGHTDDRPIRTADFVDNWELAAERALNTYRALIDHEASLGLLANARGEALLGVSGYEAQRPVSTEDSDEARRLNRRIDLRFLIAAPSEKDLTRIGGEVEAIGR